jgi:hypothetical protein
MPGEAGIILSPGLVYGVLPLAPYRPAGMRIAERRGYQTWDATTWGAAVSPEMTRV